MCSDYVVNLSPEKEKVDIKILEIDPAKIDVVVKVQEELNYSSGILREGTLAYTINSRGKKVYGNKNIRDETISYHDHIRRFEDNDPYKRKVLAFVGNGNLLMNPWFVAWVKGQLFHVKDEPIDLRQDPYSSLVVWKDKRVSIENIWFRGDNVKMDDPDSGRDITSDIIYTTYGQRLMEHRQFITPLKIKEQYYDLRHLLLFPFFGDEEGYLGLNELESDIDKSEEALNKLPVSLDLKGDMNKIESALRDKGYYATKEVNEEGQYRISGDKIRIVFKSGSFPHNIIGIADDEKVISILVTGKSNTAGLVLDKADTLFKNIKEKYGITINDAILLDNGDDVMMRYKGKMIIKSPRDRLRSVILYVADHDESDGLKLFSLT